MRGCKNCLIDKTAAKNYLDANAEKRKGWWTWPSSYLYFAYGLGRSPKGEWPRMTAIPAGLRRLVLRRANGRCEYCRLAQERQEATFHIDHVIPVAAGGMTVAGNLALACVSCSLRKGARRNAMDPDTGIEAPFYNPGDQDWHDHFRWMGTRLVGLTPMGRATIRALKLNRPLILAIRHEEVSRRRHPPPTPD